MWYWKNLYVSIGCSLWMIAGATFSVAAEATTLDAIAAETLRNQRQVQLLEEGWSKEQQQMLARIEALEQQRNRLQQQAARLEQHIGTERQRIEAQQRRLVETARLRDNLAGWLQDQVERLDDERRQGLPFLTEERDRRLADLRELLADPRAPLYEQFRRVSEALLVEAEYGYTSEAYRGEILLDGEKAQVDLLRIGRLALLFRTLDGAGAGICDPAEGTFTVLPNSTLAGIGRAFAVARREGGIEMVTLPVGRIDAR